MDAARQQTHCRTPPDAIYSIGRPGKREPVKKASEWDAP